MARYSPGSISDASKSSIRSAQLEEGSSCVLGEGMADKKEVRGGGGRSG